MVRSAIYLSPFNLSSLLFVSFSRAIDPTPSNNVRDKQTYQPALCPDSWILRAEDTKKKTRAQIPMKVWSHMWRQYASWRHIILIKKKECTCVGEMDHACTNSLSLSFFWRKELDQIRGIRVLVRDAVGTCWDLGFWGEILNWYSSATFAEEFRYGIRLCGLPMLQCFASFVDNNKIYIC